MAKISLKHRLERYEDFYRRAFEDVDVDELFAKGASTSENAFKDATKGKLPTGFHDAMFKRKVKDKISDKLGSEIFHRFFKHENVVLNKSGRLIMRAGFTRTLKEKTYKGGQFVPLEFFARRY